MEFEQLIKRIDWLEKQQRKSGENASAVEERLASMEREVAALTRQVKGLDKKMIEALAAAARLNQFDEFIAKQQKEMNLLAETMEKNAKKREMEAAKRQRLELETLSRSLEAFRKTANIAEIQRQLKDKAAEEIRITQAITDIKAQAEQLTAAHEQIEHTQKTLEEARRVDGKRIADLQGDLSAMRKRMDETREKVRLNADSLRVVENRLSELLASESERKQAQAVFIDQQLLAQVERDRAWKEWAERAETFNNQVAALDAQLQAVEEAARAAKRAQEAYTELNQKLERRINEVTEMQRLGDERSRQEWAAFKADDQKRWTSYTLTQEESMRELRQAVSAAEEGVARLDELMQIAQDQLHQTTDAIERQMQELMNWAHEWLTASERIMGHGKKTVKRTK